MPVLSPGEQPARPTPEATAPPPSRQHQPASFKSLRCCHNEQARAKRQRCEAAFLYPSVERAPVLVSVQVSLCEWLPLCLSALSGTSHSAASSFTPHWQPGRDRHRERRRGEKRGGRGCYLVALSLRYLSSPFCDRFTTEGTAECIWIHTQLPSLSLSLSLSLTHTHTHALQILTSLIHRKESRIEGHNRGWTRAMDVSRGWMRCERQQWKHYELLPQAGKHTACQEGHRNYSMRTNLHRKCTYTLLKPPGAKACEAQQLLAQKCLMRWGKNLEENAPVLGMSGCEELCTRNKRRYSIFCLTHIMWVRIKASAKWINVNVPGHFLVSRTPFKNEFTKCVFA